jgi:cysteine desulfurase
VIYLDHNASTPVRPEVVEAMCGALDQLGANPSSLHGAGQRSRAAIDRARQQVAALVGARPGQVVFTSGGTEGDHLALIGGAWARRTDGRHVAFAPIEHHAVHGAAEVLAEQGIAHFQLGVDAGGRVEPESLESMPRDTTVVSIMLANNETGVIQPVAEIAARARRRGARVHCDAVQAAGKLAVDLAELDVDYLVISAHKLGGPKGVGALIVSPDAPLAPLLRGSGHEAGRRGGTENLPGIVGLGVAAECAGRDLATEEPRLLGLRDRLETGLREVAPDIVVHGARVPRLANTVNASFPGARSDHLLMALDARGIAVSAGAACASGAVEPSPVLSAMGVPRSLAVCSIRFSLGRTTRDEDVERLIAALRESLPIARRLGAGEGAEALR